MDRPINLRPHLGFDALHDTNARVPAEDRRYRCQACGVVGDAWQMDYTPCPNFSPPHVTTRLQRATWNRCTLCGIEWEFELPRKGIPKYPYCPVAQRSHGWLSSHEIEDNSVYVCNSCGITGSSHELDTSVCHDPDLTPCEYCNIAVRCAEYCPGMGEALAGLISQAVDDNEEEDDWGQTWTPDDDWEEPL